MENLPDDEFDIQEDDNGDIPFAHEGYNRDETEVIEINKTDNIFVNGHAGEPINLVVNNVVNVKGNDVFASFDRNFTHDLNNDDLLAAFDRDMEDCDVAIYRGTVPTGQNDGIPFTANIVTDINTREKVYSDYQITEPGNITKHRLLKVEGDLVLKLPRNSVLLWSESEFCNCPPVYTLKAIRNNYEPLLEDLNDIAEPIAATNNIDLPYQLHQQIILNRNEGASLNATRQTTLLPNIDRGLLQQNDKRYAPKRQYSPANLGNFQTPNYLDVIEKPQEPFNGMVTDSRQEDALMPRQLFGSYLPHNNTPLLPLLRGTNNFDSREKYSGHNAKDASVDNNKRFKSLEFNQPFQQYQSSKNIRGDPENTFLGGSLPKNTENGNANKMKVHNHPSNCRTCRILTKSTIKQTEYSSKDVLKNVPEVDGTLQRQQSGKTMSAGSSLPNYAPVQSLERHDKAEICMKGMGKISKAILVNKGFPYLSSLQYHESFNNTRGGTSSTTTKTSGHLSLSSADTKQEKQVPLNSVGVQLDTQYPWDLRMNKKENQIHKHTAGATGTFHEPMFKAPSHSKYYPAHPLAKNNKMYAGSELPILPTRMNDRAQNGYGERHLQAGTSRYHPCGVQNPQNVSGYRVQPNGVIYCQVRGNAQNSGNMQHFYSSNFGRHNNNSRMNEHNLTGLQQNDSVAQQGYVYSQNKPFTTTRHYPNAQ